MKLVRLFLLLLLVGTGYSCEKSVPDQASDIAALNKQEVKGVAKLMAKAIANQDYALLSNEGKFQKFKKEAETYFHQSVDVKYSDVEAFRKQFMAEYTAPSNTNKNARVRLDDFTYLRNRIKEEASTASSLADLNTRLDLLISEVSGNTNLTADNVDRLYAQIEVTREVATTLVNEDPEGEGGARVAAASFSCKGFWRKLCVAASAGAAIALTVGNPAVAVIIATGGVGFFAACCLCGCTCPPHTGC